MTEPRDEPTPDLEQALAAYLDAQRMTRRQLLERIAAVGAAAALAPVIAACASGPAADASGAHRFGAAAAPVPAPVVLPVVPVVPVASVPEAPVQAAAAGSHMIARIIARIVSRG